MTSATPIRFRRNPGDTSPLYLQVAAALERHLRMAGRDGATLPPERTLAQLLDVSRVTARKAIDQLAAKGLVLRRHGSGNYIAPHLVQGLARLSGFSEELRERGWVPGSRWLSHDDGPANAAEAAALGIAEGARVARLQRLRLADDMVMAYESTVLPRTLLGRNLRFTGSLYARLARVGKAPVRAVQHMRAINADLHLAQQLGVVRKAALLRVDRVGYAASGEAVEWTQSYCRGDTYDFIVELRRSD